VAPAYNASNAVSISSITSPTRSAYFNGQIDDVLIFSRALSAPEVRDLYLDSLAGHPRMLNWNPGYAPSYSSGSVKPYWDLKYWNSYWNPKYWLSGSKIPVFMRQYRQRVN
jgi:hypothetical protein